MYAVIQTGGHQYRVAVGDQLDVEKLPVEPGTEITLDHVALSGAGKPMVLRVGSQMRRQDEGEWALASGSSSSRSKGEPVVSDGEAKEPSTDAANADESPAPSGAESDVLKKLMQKRQAEVKNESE